MPSDLQAWHPDHLAQAKGSLRCRAVNTVNEPIPESVGEAQIRWMGNGSAQADVYELTFTVTGGNVTAMVNALIGGSKNAYHSMSSPVAIVADGTTENLDVIGGIAFPVAAGVATGWTCRIAVGCYLEDDGSYVSYFAFGIVEAGNASAGQKVAVKNVGDEDAANCEVVACPGFHLSGGSYDVLVKFVRAHSSSTLEKHPVPGTYAITFADWNGTNHTADVYVDGVKAIEDAAFDGATIYGYGSGNGYVDAADKLHGLQVCFAVNTADPTANTITLVVRDGSSWLKYAPDNAGVPGAYAAADLTLTEVGQVAGRIRTGQAASYWHTWDVPDGTTPAALREMIPRYRSLSI